jgi:hypothetical protein
MRSAKRALCTQAHGNASPGCSPQTRIKYGVKQETFGILLKLTKYVRRMTSGGLVAMNLGADRRICMVWRTAGGISRLNEREYLLLRAVAAGHRATKHRFAHGATTSPKGPLARALWRSLAAVAAAPEGQLAAI